MLWLVVVWLPAAPARITGRRDLQSCGSATFVAAPSYCSNYNSRNCYDDVPCGETCEGDGECGTDGWLDNCGGYDVYERSCSPTPSPTATPAPTVTPAPTLEGCALYVVGPVAASQSNQVATVDSLQNYELTFTMELASDWSITGQWMSIITIGDSHGQRFPAVLFHPNGGLHVMQSRSYCDACCCQWGANQATGVIFEAGKTYETKVQVKSNQMTVYVDGIVVGAASGSATYAVTDAAVYVGDPWHPTAKVTLSHICFREVPGLPSPAPTLTRAPTVTPIPTADICGGGPGTSTYDGRTLRCIQLSDGEAVDVLEVEGIVQTCRYHDDNSCPAGFDIWVPRSYEHAKAVVNAVDVEFTYLVGVYRNEDGPNGWPNEGNEEDCGGCTDVAMNSDNYADWVAQGTNRVPWTSVAGSPWFLRSTTYSEPNGNYESGCWLTTNWDDGWVDGEGFSFDDGGCGYCFTKYLCSTNRASTFSPTITPAPTATPAPTPDRCTLYVAGPVVASHGNKVATVDSLQNYELTFTMELASDWSPGGGWHCILHIGNLDRQRLPGLWFHNSQNALHVRQSQSSEWSDYGPYETTGEAFAAGETYDIKVVVQNNQMTVYVDGVVVGTASGSATYTTSAAVYVGGQWHDAAAVTLSQICLKEIVYPSPAPVTPIPTSPRPTTPQSESCQRPSWGCLASYDVYTNTDCDGDGILDHMCTTSINSNRWLILSSEGCPQDWGTSSRAASECAPTTGTYIPGTYRLIGTSMGRSNYGVHYVTYTVTEDGKVEVIDVMHVNTHNQRRRRGRRRHEPAHAPVSAKPTARAGNPCPHGHRGSGPRRRRFRNGPGAGDARPQRHRHFGPTTLTLFPDLPLPTTLPLF